MDQHEFNTCQDTTIILEETKEGRSISLVHAIHPTGKTAYIITGKGLFLFIDCKDKLAAVKEWIKTVDSVFNTVELEIIEHRL